MLRMLFYLIKIFSKSYNMPDPSPAHLFSEQTLFILIDHYKFPYALKKETGGSSFEIKSSTNNILKS